MAAEEILKAGDVLLYKPSGLYGLIISAKTWHKIGHVEISLGDGTSAASRDSQGVGIYSHRASKLTYVLRPINGFDEEGAREWLKANDGQPYGWVDLLQFIGLNVDGPGIVCSPAATEILRAGKVPIFNNEPSLKIAPFQFLTSELLTDITKDIL